MAIMYVRHRVNDYAAWREVYDSVRDVQQSGGVTAEAVYRDVDDANTLLVMHQFESAEKARAFLENPDLRAAMERGGVDVSSLRAEIYEET